MKLRKRTFKTAGCILLLLFLCSYPAVNSHAQADKVTIEAGKEGGYTLCLEGKPFFIKGTIYNPTPIGRGPGYNFFTHRPKPWFAGDGKLMEKMGINTIRIYSTGDDLDAVKEFIRDLYQNYRIRTAVSDWLGLWDYPQANYADPVFREKTKNRVLRIVKELKDEKGVLMWILGNENNYTFSGKIGFWTSPEIEKIDKIYKKQQKRAEIYYRFIDELAEEIKKIDPNHPVALGNGETSFLDIAAESCANIDMLAIIIYRGPTFGNTFENIRCTFDKPIVVSEFGCDSYDAYRKKEDQKIQAEFLASQWKEIYKNSTISGNQNGNVCGGFIFEWTDEWWKHNEGYRQGWSKHDLQAGWSNGSYYYDIRAKHNLNMNEEWFGIISLRSQKEDGANQRAPKKAYYKLKEYFEKIKARKKLPPAAKNN